MTTAQTITTEPVKGATASEELRAGTNESAVSVHSLGKCFRIYDSPGKRLLEWCTFNRVNRHTDFWALRDISVSVARGECLGIIGENGSGKSTLVKTLAGALYPTQGSCSVSGRALALMELGGGLNPQLSGRENVENLSRLLGLGATHARNEMERIESFAELGAFFDRPIGVYSAGMRLRLTFSTFAAFQPDVLIIDEALSVGDVFFQQKCAARIREMLARGVTLVLVSHDMSAVQNLCDRVLLLRKGSPAFLGAPEEAVSRYLSGGRNCGIRETKPARTNSPGARSEDVFDHDIIGERAERRHGAGALRILAARVTDANARDTLSFEVGETASITVVIDAIDAVADPRAGIRLFDRLGNHVFGAGTALIGQPLPAVKSGDRLVVRFDLTLDIKPGRYTLGMAASEPAADPDPNTAAFHDSIDMLGPIHVRGPAQGGLPFFGLARLPMSISHEVVGRG